MSFDGIPQSLATKPRPAFNGEIDWSHPRLQSLLSNNAKLELYLKILEDILDDPYYVQSPGDAEHWQPIHDKALNLVQTLDYSVSWLQDFEEYYYAKHGKENVHLKNFISNIKTQLGINNE